MKVDRANWAYNGEVVTTLSGNENTVSFFYLKISVDNDNRARKALLKEPIYGVSDGGALVVSAHPFYQVGVIGSGRYF